ncbi:carbon-nitrogen hydrolase family protein [Variovorax sp. WS11]|uniref:carbon-nitrogen hydrolase family protein n=1 Tax=Variovorax sp. WS11 TaxID=1105204 RepID=UPI000D0D9218|nr:carbon-nitrogen hydrolase family protein [Variovorax sp. WS11]NDZ12591.1 carbon-nitrogen hydrolase family protein [Variovorax sp. WS11]PSL82598.1 carbon-nitrogen hydrolase family protein [Variovorax sp. WS11]
MNLASAPGSAATTFGVAGVQMNVSAFESNVERMGNYLRHIRTRFPWVRMVLFSELAALGPKHDKAEPLPGPTEARLAELARETGLWLIPGSLFERAQGPAGPVVYNTTPVINPQGEVVTRFRKLFPFRPYERDVAGGTGFCVFDVPGAGRFGVSICYDMWFPETTRTLAAMGAEVILHPTMTDTIDRDVELAIARASAVTNQLYFFDVNGVGDGGVGRSIICDPSGYVLHQADGGAEIMAIDVDFARVRRERERGLRSNLGQPLKSFRDRDCDFDVYRKDAGAYPYLQTLGPLVKPD